MRALIQRVTEAKVEVDDQVTGSIGRGVLILLGVEEEDGDEDLNWLAKKISGLRIFDDADGKMNLSTSKVDGEFLVVSQFTLLASTKKGNRPSFIHAANPEKAEKDYLKFCQLLRTLSGCNVEKGKFGAEMTVSLVNDGPVTIPIDSKIKE